jgi:hypothetical protein
MSYLSLEFPALDAEALEEMRKADAALAEWRRDGLREMFRIIEAAYLLEQDRPKD